MLSSIMLLIKIGMLSRRFIVFKNLVTMLYAENYQILFCYDDVLCDIKESEEFLSHLQSEILGERMGFLLYSEHREDNINFRVNEY